MSVLALEIILYVNHQEDSMSFYSNLLRQKPSLHVPGMTEFHLTPTCKLGLMPNNRIAKIISPPTPHPNLGNGIPRCELYFFCTDVQLEFSNAIGCGAKLVSPIEDRDWGDRVCYFADPDGHIIAFAERMKT